MPFGSGVITSARIAEVLDPADATLGEHVPLRPAAVLAVILGGRHVGESSRLLLIERAHAGQHPGQLAFPGGKPEAHDRDLLHTALREANEEVHVPATGLEVLGRLEPVPTPTGFLIVPFVACETSGWEPSTFNYEVERVITPTMGELADPHIHEVRGARQWRGRSYALHQFAIGQPPLWGATARMVWDLLTRLRSRRTAAP